MLTSDCPQTGEQIITEEDWDSSRWSKDMELSIWWIGNSRFCYIGQDIEYYIPSESKYSYGQFGSGHIDQFQREVIRVKGSGGFCQLRLDHVYIKSPFANVKEHGV